MNRTVFGGPLAGCVAAVPSKSQAHRLLLCAALGERPVSLACGGPLSRDIAATMDCLRALGADIAAENGVIRVAPAGAVPGGERLLPCGESGSTLRFLLPVAGALGVSARFRREGRLPERPLDALAAALTAHGMELREDGADLLCRGRLQCGDFSLPGNISSQYLSGLLFALPLLPGESRLHITTGLESGAYLQMTVRALEQSGIRLTPAPDGYTVPGGQTFRLPEGCRVEGDWSNAAFFLCAGALAGPVAVTGLDPDSPQGDRRIAALLARFGARVETDSGRITVSPGALRGLTVDAADIPDLVPVLCAVGAAAEGETVITRAGRLRLKESDRLAAAAALLNGLGGCAAETADGLVIRGGAILRGGAAETRGDHRMAMTAAVCALWCREPVTILGAECVAKSYPAFFEDWESLRKEIRL